jgi:hypothetical protein
MSNTITVQQQIDICDQFSAALSRAKKLQSLAVGAGDLVSAHAFGADAAQLSYTVTMLQQQASVQWVADANDAIKTVTAAQAAIQQSITQINAIIKSAQNITTALNILDQVIALAAKLAPA